MKKRLKYGGMSIIVTILFLAGVVLLNMLAGLLSDRFYLKADLTAGNLFEISDDTAKILKDINEPVTLTVLSTETDYQNTTGLVIIREILQKYAALSDGDITVRYIDPTLNPALPEQYSLVTFGMRDIIVESERRYTAVICDELFQFGYDYQTGYQYISAVQAEQKLTNALLYVLSEVSAKAAILTGHNEYGSQTFEAFLKDSNYQVEEADLRTADMPDDATLAIIIAPEGDYTAAEIEKIDAFLASGGNVIWLEYEGGQYKPNLKGYFLEWGVYIEPSVIFEPDRSEPLYPHIIYPLIAVHEATALIDQSGSMGYFAPVINPFTRIFETKGSRATYPLLTTTAQSYARLYEDLETSTSFEREPGDISGPFDVGVLCVETTYDSQGAARRSMVLATGVSPIDYFDNTNLNAKFFTGVLSYMSPASEMVYVPARDIIPGSMQVLAGQSTVLFWILMSIPLLILALGIVVWRRRRHL